MNKINIIENIDKSIFEIERYIEKYKIPSETKLNSGHLRVLKLLKNEILENDEEINTRVLCAFKDVCTSTAIENEESMFYNPIFEIYDEFEKNIKNFKDLELLRMDFEKGNPI